LITESADLTIEYETLEIDVGATEACKTWSLIASTGLKTDCIEIRILRGWQEAGSLTESVLDNVDTSNTVAAGNGVDLQEAMSAHMGIYCLIVCTNLQEQLNWVGDGLVTNHQLDWESLSEEESEILWLVWGIQGVNSLREIC